MRLPDMGTEFFVSAWYRTAAHRRARDTVPPHATTRDTVPLYNRGSAVVPAQFYCDVNNNSMAPNNANFVNLGVKKPFEGET